MKKKQRDGEGVDYDVMVMCTTVTNIILGSPAKAEKFFCGRDTEKKRPFQFPDIQAAVKSISHDFLVKAGAYYQDKNPIILPGLEPFVWQPARREWASKSKDYGTILFFDCSELTDTRVEVRPSEEKSS